MTAGAAVANGTKIRCLIADANSLIGGTRARMTPSDRWNARTTACPSLPVAPVMIARQFGLLAWPVLGVAAVLGFLAWRLYETDGAEQSLLRAVVAALLMAIATFSLILPSLGQLFPSVSLARVLRDSGCVQPVAASAGYHEPSLVFLAGTSTRLTDAAGAAEFLRGGDCRFAFVEARQERSFAQRAEAIGLRYTRGPRVDGINLSTGSAVTIAVYRSGSPS